MSRNIGEYLAATAQNKKPTQEEAETDEILLSDADDQTFEKVVEKMNE